ncbi:glycosyltransferase family 4 protein [Anaerobacillus sp. MEB173]|uniref:glycosyltransferase family 4 protein n=1 Tax=Anaerobacillus sp. MEB173 TaxID=3383345 RepID=UPI003F90D0AD
MKVAMISWEYPPQFSGGLGVHCEGITQELTNIGIEIEFYLPAFKKFEFIVPEGMTLHHVQMNKKFSDNSYLGSVIWDFVLDFKSHLEVAFQPDGIDIIHAHDWMGVFAASGISQKYKIPLIWTVHSTEYDRAGGKSLNPAIYSIEQEALDTVKHTIAVSKRTKQILIDRYQAKPDRITSIYNGVHISPFEQMAVRDYQVTDGHILFLGRLTGQKAPDDFLQAASYVLEERNDLKFMLAGDGDLLNKLRLKARRLNIQNRVEFTGSVVGEKLLDCYKNASMFVLPARSEPFGITVLEAMAAGLPTIISNTTGVGEIVKNVLVVEPNQPKELAKAILKLLNEPALRQTLGQQGAQEVRKFSWKQVANETHQLYLKSMDTK